MFDLPFTERSQRPAERDYQKKNSILIISTFWVLLLLTVQVAYHHLSKWISYHTAAWRHGCQKAPRYPFKDSLFGSDLQQERVAAMQAGKLNVLYLAHFETYGKTFHERSLHMNTINTMEVANVRQVMANSFEDWGKPASRKRVSEPFLRDGITFSDGAQWKFARNLVKPTFSRAEISDLDSFKTFVNRFMKHIPKDGSTFDAQPLLHNLFLDSSTDFIFGRSVDALLHDSSFDTDEFLNAFNTALAGVGIRRNQAGFFKLLRLRLSDPPWHRAIAIVHGYVDRQVAKALEETKELHGKQSAAPGRYVLLYEMAKQIRDPIELRYQLLSTFIPARDTTSILVSNMLFHLARNPKVWAELRTDALALEDKPLTFELLKSLTRFRHVLFETIRVQGPSGRMYRVAVKDTMLPTGGGTDGKAPIFVAKGTTLALNLWTMHHDKDIWGEDVNLFKPNRWENRPPPMWEFVPFSGGPRICPAQQQVLTQAIYLLVRLTREFAMIKNKDPMLEYVERTKMTTESRNGVQIALLPA